MDAIRRSGPIDAPQQQGSAQGQNVNINKIGESFKNTGAEKNNAKTKALDIVAENKLFLGALISPEHTGRWVMENNSSENLNVLEHLKKVKNSLEDLDPQIKDKTIYIMTKDAIQEHQDRRTNNEWYKENDGGGFLHGIESQLEILDRSITIPKATLEAINTALSGKIEEAKKILNSQIIRIQEEN